MRTLETHGTTTCTHTHGINSIHAGSALCTERLRDDTNEHTAYGNSTCLPYCVCLIARALAESHPCHYTPTAHYIANNNFTSSKCSKRHAQAYTLQQSMYWQHITSTILLDRQHPALTNLLDG